MDGGVFGFLGLIQRHRGAVEYDWRTRFGGSVYDVGKPGCMTLTEAGRLAMILAGDPSSMVAAALQDWDYPISQETIVLADIFDLEHMVNSSSRGPKPKPHSIRPFKTGETQQRYGDTGGRTSEEVRALLESARNGITPASGA